MLRGSFFKTFIVVDATGPFFIAKYESSVAKNPKWRK
jgi:hypothetical protein